ncbi:MAG: hypothetical protein IIW48_06315 [Clostridia bacterium]|nr:hypothetical protein [Clostridia bacterium]
MKIIKYFPGIILSFVIAALAMWLESLLPIHLIGSAVIAMFIGNRNKTHNLYCSYKNIKPLHIFAGVGID